MTDKRKVPIDIHYKQLLETLLDRRIVPKRWLDQHKQIRDAIAALYSELPLDSDQLSQFQAKNLRYEDLHYYDCKFILQCLEQSDEGAAKNLFGQYTSPLLKKWRALVRQYEKNHVFVAESARCIAQNTAFEIPFLKMSIQQNEKQVADNNRKIADLTRNITEFKRKLEVSCTDIGITGEDFGEELRRLPRELPNIFDKVAKTICCDEIVSAITYHQALQNYLHNCEMPAMTSVAECSSSSFSKKGENSRKKGKKLTKVVGIVEEREVTTDEVAATPHNFFSALKELCSASDVVPEVHASFDYNAEAAEISWDISLGEDRTADVNEIDWGIEMVGSTEPIATSNNTPVEIDWGSTSSYMVKPVSDLNGAEGIYVVEPAPKVPATAETITRVGLLDDYDFRTRALNDLLELQAFLRQRKIELSGNNSVAFANQFQGFSSQLEQQSLEKVKEFEAAVNNAISLLTNKRLQQLVLLKTSERYFDRHVANLEMLTKHMDKCRREIQALENKNAALIDATKNVYPQISSLVATTKKLKKELEAVLPSLFKGYKVNIVGEVNSF
ncbi:unnamed protein product [Peronospora belbahrii]|uniref:CDK5 regulatory subunit-associated protein 3 n=1 Tax=Peronospora belbahrii TaxID=622444 RepID=A0ABN8D8Q3_9STRA|nr:unnamed protein product [Peronospora belbahrii]